MLARRVQTNAEAIDRQRLTSRCLAALRLFAAERRMLRALEAAATTAASHKLRQRVFLILKEAAAAGADKRLHLRLRAQIWDNETKRRFLGQMRAAAARAAIRRRMLSAAMRWAWRQIQAFSAAIGDREAAAKAARNRHLRQQALKGLVAAGEARRMIKLKSAKKVLTRWIVAAGERRRALVIAEEWREMRIRKKYFNSMKSSAKEIEARRLDAVAIETRNLKRRCLTTLKSYSSRHRLAKSSGSQLASKIARQISTKTLCFWSTRTRELQTVRIFRTSRNKSIQGLCLDLWLRLSRILSAASAKRRLRILRQLADASAPRRSLRQGLAAAERAAASGALHAAWRRLKSAAVRRAAAKKLVSAAGAAVNRLQSVGALFSGAQAKSEFFVRATAITTALRLADARTARRCLKALARAASTAREARASKVATLAAIPRLALLRGAMRSLAARASIVEMVEVAAAASIQRQHATLKATLARMRLAALRLKNRELLAERLGRRGIARLVTAAFRHLQARAARRKACVSASAVIKSHRDQQIKSTFFSKFSHLVFNLPTSNYLLSSTIIKSQNKSLLRSSLRRLSSTLRARLLLRAGRAALIVTALSAASTRQISIGLEAIFQRAKRFDSAQFFLEQVDLSDKRCTS